MIPILADSSFLYALYNTSDSHHIAAMEFASQYRRETIVPQVVLPEVTFLFQRDLGYYALQNFYAAFAATSVKLESLYPVDLIRVYQIAVEYGDAEFDFVDICIMAMAERLNIQ